MQLPRSVGHLILCQLEVEVKLVNWGQKGAIAIDFVQQ